MSFKLPGTDRRIMVTPIKIVALVLLVPLIWGSLVLFKLWQYNNTSVEQVIDVAKSGTLAPEHVGQAPVFVKTTPTGESTSPASPPMVETTTGPSATGTGAPGSTATTPATAGPTEPGATPTAGATPTTLPSAPRIKDFHGKPRVNVMMIGLDKRGDEIGRTDTIILAQLDFEQDKVRVLSIPRDLYVNIYGDKWGYYKINAAYPLGEEDYEDPTSGTELLMQTIRYNFNIDLDYYARVEFPAFVKGVDTLGGIEINVPKRLEDPCYPDGYKCKKVVFKPGRQRMNGETALIYSRTRHADSDLGRIKRQQQVMLAIQDKARSPGALLKIPTFLDILTNNFKTNVNLGDQVRLAQWVAGVPKQNIQFHSLTGPEQIVEGSGEYVIEAKPEILTPILQQVFGPQARYTGAATTAQGG